MSNRMYLSADKEVRAATRDAHWRGNNAAFVCPMCGHVYIVSAAASKKDPEMSAEGKNVRKEHCPNPKCRQSIARIWMRCGEGEAWIEWPVEKEAE